MPEKSFLQEVASLSADFDQAPPVGGQGEEIFHIPLDEMMRERQKAAYRTFLALAKPERNGHGAGRIESPGKGAAA